MKRKIFKAFFAVVTVAAVGLGSYKAYGSYVAANHSETDLLLTEDVLALSDPNAGNNSTYTFDGGFKDCHMDVSYCENCGMSLGSGTCSLMSNLHWGCSYTVTKQVAAHMYDCWTGSRMTEAECKAIMRQYSTHPKAGCSGHY